jgi:ADP-dependent NAD(P)H-hydrate dehydratase / NAD(P)H-hydrate epimerase
VDFPLVLTAVEMREADVAVARTLGVPTLRLMETAGRGVAAVVRRELGGRPGRVTIVCGGGSNGGDGFVAARQLALAGLSVRVLLASPKAKVQGDAAAALAALEQLGSVTVEDGSAWVDEATWRARIEGTGAEAGAGKRGVPGDAVVDGVVDVVVDAVVDAIFGTGFRGSVREVPAAALRAMNAAGGRKIAVDIPSGLDADSGRAAGVVFRADVTATMGARKLGLVIDASAPVGRLEVVDLGAPVDGGIAPSARCRLLDTAGIAARVPRRSADAHKGSSGHLLVVAGSAGKTGAAFLVGTAALRSGAGLVTIASTAAGQTALDAKAIELMTARYTDAEDAEPGPALAALQALAGRAQAVALGPGIPTGAGMRAVVHELASRLPLPMVIDADALNALGTDAPQLLSGAPAPRVLTPHPGEMGRLLGISIAEVQSDRLVHARALAAATGAIVVLKGARTIIAAPDGQAFISPIACSALATAGSGDVLTGVTGALLARRLEALTAAEVAVHVHGVAGQSLAPELGDGVVAGDLPRAIAGVMARLARLAG